MSIFIGSLRRISRNLNELYTPERFFLKVWGKVSSIVKSRDKKS